jgi:hypothetical protein
VVSVLAIGPKICRFDPAEDDAFLMVIKISSTASFGGEVKPSVHCCSISQHVKQPYRYGVAQSV